MHKPAHELIGKRLCRGLAGTHQRSGAAFLLALLSFHAIADDLNFTDYAAIESVEPIVTRERFEEPVQECRPVHAARTHSGGSLYRERTSPPRDVLRSVVGGLIGGVVGSRFGGGRGRQAMAVLGAMGGAAIAGRSNDEERQRDYVYRRNRVAVAEHCAQVTRVRDVEVISAYRVRYRYQGQLGTRIVYQPPGDRLPVTVTLRPLADHSRR